MRTSILALVVGCLFAIGAGSQALCEDLVGTVVNRDGHAVQGVKIITHARDGQPTGSAVSDVQGQYSIADLQPGEYFITLDPGSTNVQGQTVASYVGNAGLTVNWSVAMGLAPLASAQPGVQFAAASPAGSNALPVGSTALSKSSDPPPGCKGMPGPPCGPKKSKKSKDD
jgi:Carboxypeptidase regulatory-like domain